MWLLTGEIISDGNYIPKPYNQRMLFEKIFRKRVLCYVLVFDQVEIIRKSLTFLSEHANALEIIVIENPSPNSAEIGKIVSKLGEAGKVARHYLFSTNITGRAYDMVIQHEAERVSKARFVMITDGDLTCSEPDWLDEEMAILKNSEVFACGVSLDMSNLPIKAFPSSVNWIPKDISTQPSYFEALTGGHLLLLRGRDLSGFMDWKQRNNRHFLDSDMHDYCYKVLSKRWARTKRSTAYHWTWDLYQDTNHPYTALKTNKSFDDTWRHNQSAEYSLTVFRPGTSTNQPA